MLLASPILVLWIQMHILMGCAFIWNIIFLKGNHVTLHVEVVGSSTPQSSDSLSSIGIIADINDF